jgi:hypothetical protein
MSKNDEEEILSVGLNTGPINNESEETPQTGDSF